MAVYNNILEAIGDTPMIRLQHLPDPDGAEILVKFEGLNIGGSIKTRTALNMITRAEEQGLLNQDSIIVEPTSGNQGIGLALVGAVKGYRTIIIMPDSVSEERRKLVNHYGAEVRLVHDDGNIGKCIEECLATALKLRDENPNIFVPQQFENPANADIQRSRTGIEILQQVGKPIDGFCSGIGTGGTITGIGETLKKEKRRDPFRRFNRYACADGHRRRHCPADPQRQYLRRYLYHRGRGSHSRIQGACLQRRHHVRYFQRDECCGSTAPCKKTRQR